MEEYLNRAPFGANVVGLASASRVYWGKSARELTFAEVSLLVALLPKPAQLDPRRALAAACAQRDTLLRRLLKKDQLGTEVKAALEAPCILTPSRPLSRLAPNALQHLRANPPPGLVQTTIDLTTQATVEAVLGGGAAERLRAAGAHQAAVVVLDSATSEVRALLGSFDFDEQPDGQIDGTLFARQSGSALKPFLYLEALRTGFTLETGIDDLPTTFAEGTGRYSPQNADGLFRGRTTLREALAQSRNVPAVRLAQAIKPQRFAAVLVEFGIRRLAHPAEWYGLGIAIGTAEVRLLELTGAYAALGRKCVVLPPTLTPQRQAERRGADPEHCSAVLDALRDEDARVRGFGSVARLGFAEPVAIKTGTSTGSRDMWLFAVTSQFTVGIWAGNFDMAPAGEDAAAMDLLAPVAQELLRDFGAR